MRCYLRILAATAAACIHNALIAAPREAGVWQVLHGCQLVNTANNQGDRVKVQHANQEFTIQLYFVDSPQADHSDINRVRDQARYFALSETAIIAAGKRARQLSTRFLQGPFTVITQWQDARFNQDPSYFGLIQKDSKLLSTTLVQHGAARIYGMPTQSSWPGGLTPRAYLTQLKYHERIAQSTAAGIWTEARNAGQIAGLDQLGSLQHSAPMPPQQTLGEFRSSDPVILNSADAASLETLPGIGPSLAARIIARRPFTTVDDLTSIPGISANTVDRFRAQVRVDAPPPPPSTAP